VPDAATTIRDIIDRHARERPQAPFILAPEPDRVLTYGGLRELARGLAGELAAHGIAPGEVVSYMLPNGIAAAGVLLGAMHGGYVASPVSLLAQDALIEHTLAHSRTRIVFVAPEFAPRLASIAAKIGSGVVVRVSSPDDLAVGALRDTRAVTADAPALLMYTSGTTGRPKGAVLSHANLVHAGRAVTAAHALTPEDRVLSSLPLYHVNGQCIGTISPLVAGGSVVMPHRFSASQWWGWVERYRPTWLNVVPTIIAYLLNGPDPRERGLAIDRVRFCRSASAPLPPDLHRAFERKFGIGIIETFGMTETNAPCFTNPLDPARRKVGSPGPAYGNEAKIIDAASGTTLPPGVAGEIMVRGDNLMTGYYKDPETTARTLEPDGWMHTGDLGYLDEDGFLFVTGRIKELIIKGGENIAPREIDEALLKHPAVLEAAAVGIPDPHYGQEIMACVVLKAGHPCTEAELAEFSRRELGKYKAPKVIRVVENLPKGPSGKVQRLKLLESLPATSTLLSQ